jgi:bidirectional [NiFe] hydrogenase diaphorase subunit
MLIERSTKDRAIAGQFRDDPRLDVVSRALKRFGYQQDALIEVLHIAQQTFGYLPIDILSFIADRLKLPLSWVYGVASFYHYFSFQPPAAHSCVVCTGTACYVEGVDRILKLIKDEFGIAPGETTADGRLRVDDFRCPGSCGLAPVLVIDGQLLGRETPQSTLKRIRDAMENGSTTPHNVPSLSANGGQTAVDAETAVPPQEDTQ